MSTLSLEIVKSWPSEDFQLINVKTGTEIFAKLHGMYKETYYKELAHTIMEARSPNVTE